MKSPLKMAYLQGLSFFQGVQVPFWALFSVNHANKNTQSESRKKKWVVFLPKGNKQLVVFPVANPPVSRRKFAGFFWAGELFLYVSKGGNPKGRTRRCSIQKRSWNLTVVSVVKFRGCFFPLAIWLRWIYCLTHIRFSPQKRGISSHGLPIAHASDCPVPLHFVETSLTWRIIPGLVSS